MSSRVEVMKDETLIVLQGTPKGVVLQHQAISTSSRATGSVMGLERGTRVLAFASFTYDVSLQDGWLLILSVVASSTNLIPYSVLLAG